MDTRGDLAVVTKRVPVRASLSRVPSEHSNVIDCLLFLLKPHVSLSTDVMKILCLLLFLSVSGPPQSLTLTPQGDTVTWDTHSPHPVTCQASSAKPPVTLHFTISGKEVPGNQTTVRSQSHHKLYNTQSVIIVTPTVADHGNEVICEARGRAIVNSLQTGFQMNILYPPDPPIIEGYSGEGVKVGTKLHLVCVSRGGNPHAMLRWSKAGAVIMSQWETDDSDSNSRSSLAFTVSVRDNLITLTCQAHSQVLPTPLLRSVTLHVLYPPSNVQIQGQSKLVEDRELSLSCRSGFSHPQVTIRWRVGGHAVTPSAVYYIDGPQGGSRTVSNLTMTVSRADNSKTITCEAFSKALGVSKSASVILKVTYPPDSIWIEGPPPLTPLPVASVVTLICYTSGGNPPPRLVWKKGARPVTGGEYTVEGEITRSSLTLETKPSDNSAVYTCLTSNLIKSQILTSSITLSVHFPPIDVNITCYPGGDLPSGTNVTLVCRTGSANPPPHIIWSTPTERVDSTHTVFRRGVFEGVTAISNLSLTLTSADHGQRVRCEGHSPALHLSLNTFHTLSVLYPPEFGADQRWEFEGVEGGSALLTLSLSANPPHFNVTWSHRGQQLTGGWGPIRYQVDSGGSLRIWRVRREDSGSYSVRAENHMGFTLRSVTLSVQYSPRISYLPDVVEGSLGETVELVCQVDANPVTNTTVQWRWIGEGRRVTESDQRFAVGEARLVLNDIQNSDTGRYECVTDNGINPTHSSTTQLYISFSPVISKSQFARKVGVNGDGTNSVSLRCQTRGFPNVTFIWVRAGHSLSLPQPRLSERSLVEGDFQTSVLTIVNVSMEDFSVYSCIAHNKLGSDVLDITLGQTDRPDPPTGLRTLRTTHNSLTLTWRPGFDGGLDQQFILRYCGERDPGVTRVEVFPPQASVFTITGLRPLTRYNMSVSSLNRLGESHRHGDNTGISVVTAGLYQLENYVTLSPEVTKHHQGGVRLWLSLLLGLGAAALTANLVCVVYLSVTHPPTPPTQAHSRTPTSGCTLRELNLYTGRDNTSLSVTETLSRTDSNYEEYTAERAEGLRHVYESVAEVTPSDLLGELV